MDRYVHHQLRAVYTAFAALVICVAVTSGVRGELMTSYGVGWFALGVVAFPVVFTLLAATRLKWVGDIRDFETAVSLEETPDGVSLRRHPVNWWLFTVMLVPTLALAIGYAEWIALLPLWSALISLGQVWVAADWERKNGKVLWRGHDTDAPWKLSYSPGALRGKAPARTTSA